VTANSFRRIALGMKDAVEGAHMGHPDFRVNGRIFATIHPDPKWAMVSLTPEQQQKFVAEAPNVFVPEKGAWGLQGLTAVSLAAADEEMVGEALTLARQSAIAKGPVRPRKKKGKS